MGIFGHHARTRKLVGLNPLKVRCPVSAAEIESIFGEAQLMEMFQRRGYQVEYAQAAPRRRVYDCFTYNGEFEVLQIRLHELADVVDCFVIVEATRTFSGEAKALTLDLSAPELAPFKERIRYVVVDDMPDDPPGVKPEDVERDWLNNPPKTGFWRREKYQRNQIMRGIEDARPDDLIMVSDADEIPRAEVVRWMVQQPPGEIYGLILGIYYFYVNYRNVEGAESCTIWSVAASRSWFDQGSPDQLRIAVRMGGVSAMRVPAAGWHFSYLGMSEAQIRQKIARFAHQEYNDPEILSAIDVEAIVESGMDLYGRAGYRWAIIEEDELPIWLRSREQMRDLFCSV